jgi:hypothetical protein
MQKNYIRAYLKAHKLRNEVKTHLRSSDRFALIISISNLIGYLTSFGIPIAVDYVLVNCYGYNSNIYNNLDFMILLGISITIITYWINATSHLDAPFWKASLTCLSLSLLTLASYPIFGAQNELIFDFWSNAHLIFNSATFALLTGSAAYVHHYKLDLDIIGNKKIDYQLRIDYAKMEYDIWIKIFLGFLAGYVLGCMEFLNYIEGYVKTISKDEMVQNILISGLAVALFFHVAIFIVTICRSFLIKIFYIKNKLITMEK